MLLGILVCQKLILKTMLFNSIIIKFRLFLLDTQFITMKKYLLLSFLTINLAFSQSPAGIWYFGNKAGLNFNLSANPVSINDGELETDEGCATLCDGNGNLLFYTDGINVWNRNHVIMPNGSGLKGDPSSTQSAVIVPRPGSTTIYYIFTVDELGKPNGLNYSIIDLNLDNGFGDIILKNNPLTTPTLEKITAVKHANETSVWIVGHKYGNNTFVAYELTSLGLSLPVLSNVGTTISNNTQNTIGYMKSSPNGKFIAVANAGSGSQMQLFSFNNATGQLNLVSTSNFDFNGLGAYGVEFSSNSELLYVSRIDYVNNLSEIYQFHIVSQNQTIINNSKTLISTHYHTNSSFVGLYASLQLGPDQKIYIARNNSYYLSAINNPNIVGVGCQFIENKVTLQNQCKYGLPSFVTSYLELNYVASDFCFGNETFFSAPQFASAINYLWDFGDPISNSNTSNLSNPSHIFSSAGDFIVTLTVNTSTTTSVFSKLIKIIDSPIANSVSSYIKCDENNNQTAVFDLNSKNSEVLGNQNSNNYAINYFPTLLDATNNSNQLPASYTNISNPQTIFAKIQTLDGVCFDITSFELKVNKKPKLKDDTTLYYCNNNFPNTISLHAENQNSSEILTYLWDNGATSESISVNVPGIYTVTATNNFGCSSTRTITVVSSEIAIINSIEQNQIGDYTITVNTSGSGNYVYSIDNQNDNFQLSPVFYNVSPGDHIIYVKDLNGCGTTFSDFSVIGYPKYFTPNNDGIHDYWKLQGSHISVKKLRIFNRFGKLINENHSNQGWDGKYNGQDAISTDYWFYAELESGEIIKGHFTLKR